MYINVTIDLVHPYKLSVFYEVTCLDWIGLDWIGLDKISFLFFFVLFWFARSVA